jgi:hypothetical protein
MIHLIEDVQSLGIAAPRFSLFEHVRVYAEYEDGGVFEGTGVVCGLMFEHSERYPTSQFFIDGWWYDIGFYNLPSNPGLPKMYREWTHEAELFPLNPLKH